MKNYLDNFAVFNTIGALMNNPDLLEAYPLIPDDLGPKIYVSIYKAMNNLYLSGVTQITPILIDSYLSNYPNAYTDFNASDGIKVVSAMLSKTSIDTLDFYYEQVKKRSLLQSLSSIMDLDFVYDPDTIDSNKKEFQQEWLNNSSLEDIMNVVDNRVEELRTLHFTDANNLAASAGSGIDELLASLEEEPDIGFPLFSQELNTIARGARKKKFYLRSAGTGSGKTRTFIADSLYNAADEMYCVKTKKWVSTGEKVSVALISTELDISEVQTMSLAFLSGVNEAKILKSNMTTDERKRVVKAAKILKESLFYVQELPDYDLADLKAVVRRLAREKGVQMIMFDYLHSTVKMMTTLTKQTKMAMREDQILLLMSIALKQIANDMDIFIMTATQLNAAQNDETKTPGVEMLRGE